MHYALLAGEQSLPEQSLCQLVACTGVNVLRQESLRGCTDGVMGMLECLRAPSAPPGVRAVGVALCWLPSCCLGWSLRSSRRNCELFMMREKSSAFEHGAEKLPMRPKRGEAGVHLLRAFPALRRSGTKTSGRLQVNNGLYATATKPFTVTPTPCWAKHLLNPRVSLAVSLAENLIELVIRSQPCPSDATPPSPHYYINRMQICCTSNFTLNPSLRPSACSPPRLPKYIAPTPKCFLHFSSSIT